METFKMGSFNTQELPTVKIYSSGNFNGQMY